MKHICYIGGCGRLGLSLAAWSAYKGFEAICADVNKEAVELVNAGLSPIEEPRVDLLVAEFHGKRLKATTNTETAVLASDITFVIVPTPSESDGTFTTLYITNACKKIAGALKQKNNYHVVVIVSTVMPGDTNGIIRTTLESYSGKKAGKDFGLVYSPEFIRQGSIVHDFANPDQILIGEFDKRSGDVVEEYYQSITEEEVPIKRMSLVSAEISKIGLNSAVVTKLATANQLAWLCHHHPGADARDVLSSIGADRRISNYYFSAGTPDGGPCFPRDALALTVAAKNVGLTVPIFQAAHEYRDVQRQQFARLFLDHDAPYGVLGLTYKTGVNIVEESAGYAIAKWLQDAGYKILAYDPQAVPTPAIPRIGSLSECIIHSQTLILTIPWPEFKGLEEMDLSGKTIIDCWGFLDAKKLNCNYIRFGEGKNE